MAAAQLKAPTELKSLWTLRESVTNLTSWMMSFLLIPIDAPRRTMAQVRDWRLVGAYARQVAISDRQMRLLGKKARSFLEEQFEAQERLYEEFMAQNYRSRDEMKAAWQITKAAQLGLAGEALKQLQHFGVTSLRSD